jgi:two-component system, OmpR family, sensor histidine kinase VicK
MANLLILSIPETTEIIDGAENIFKRALAPFPKINEQLDGCFDHTDPAGLVTIEPRWRAINDLAKRGVRMRYLTEIRKDNIDVRRNQKIFNKECSHEINQ